MFVSAAIVTSGCSQKRPPVVPVPVQYYESGNSPSTTLLVLLPGIHDPIDKFETHGFIDAMRQAEQPCDLISVDAHYGYYDTGTIVERLHNDVIIPAQQAGYSDIRFVGISLGGYGALLYASQYTSEVSTLVLLAPFLGHDGLIDSITAANGLEHWLPDDGPADETSSQRFWLQLKENSSSSTSFPELYLGYGSADKFRQAHALLAETLPEDHVFMVTGGHGWTSWKQLWEHMLEENILCATSLTTDTYSSPVSNSAPVQQ
ncbi:MAG: alpha/beta hydrolase [Pseudomonadota bacterium]